MGENLRESILKFVSRFICAVILVFMSFSTHAQMTCESVFISHESMAGTLRSLAHLRLQLDIAQAEGADSLVIRALKSDYAKKERLFINYVETHHVMNRAEFFERLSLEIQKIQSADETSIADEAAKEAAWSRYGRFVLR